MNHFWYCTHSLFFVLCRSREISSRSKQKSREGLSQGDRRGPADTSKTSHPSSNLSSVLSPNEVDIIRDYYGMSGDDDRVRVEENEKVTEETMEEISKANTYSDEKIPSVSSAQSEFIFEDDTYEESMTPSHSTPGRSGRGSNENISNESASKIWTSVSGETKENGVTILHTHDSADGGALETEEFSLVSDLSTTPSPNTGNRSNSACDSNCDSHCDSNCDSNGNSVSQSSSRLAQGEVDTGHIDTVAYFNL